MLEVRSPCVTPEVVLKASGHVEKLTDQMVKDEKTGTFYRADQLLKDFCNEKLREDVRLSLEQAAELRRTLAMMDDLSVEELGAKIKEYGITAPDTKNPLSDPYPFNLMFQTSVGPSGLTAAYVRPETAPGIFVNFKDLYYNNGNKLPFAAAQIGQAFRNEISPRQGFSRVREFTLAEIEHFVDPKDKSHPKFSEVKNLEFLMFPREEQMSAQSAKKIRLGEAVSRGIVNNETIGYFIGRVYLFLSRLGIDQDHLRFRQHLANEMAHYAADCWDAEIECSYGWIECVGIADRSAYDLRAHTRKLYNLRMAESTMVTDHINTLKTLFSQLTTLGHNIEENERAELLLQSLPDSYDQLIINLINNNPADSLIFDDVVASVLNEESKRKNKENRQVSSQQVEALSMTRGRSTERDPSGSHNNGRSKSRRATWHMTSRREWFHTYEPISGGSVYMGNDHALEIAGIEQGLKILSERKLLPRLKSVSLPFCEYCVTSKQYRLKFSRSIARSKCILDLIHSNVWESSDMSMGGAKYMVTFIDDYSRRCWVYPIKKKSYVFPMFKKYKARVELESRKKIKYLRTDNGGEYTDGEFFAFCKQEDIQRQFTVAYTPQQNRVAERMNKTLTERIKAMLRTAGLPNSFWAEVAKTGCYIVNRSPSTAIGLKTAMEMWTGKSKFTVRGYVDSDFTGDLDKRKSTTSYVFTLAGAAKRRQHDSGGAERMVWRLIDPQSNLQVGECQKIWLQHLEAASRSFEEAKWVAHSFEVLDAEKSGVALVAQEKFSEPREVEAMNEKEALGMKATLESKGEVEFYVRKLGKNVCIKKNMLLISKEKKKEFQRVFTPSVIEPSSGIDRIIYCLCEHCFYRRPSKAGDEQLNVFRFPPLVAPIKCTVFTLVQNQQYEEVAKVISESLSVAGISHKIDITGASIGKRYARTDELGVPCAITVDSTSSVTIRERDSKDQMRVHVDDVASIVKALTDGQRTWED
ncbi:glycine--tRNA ligase 1 [Citrus sinensis]|uniref:Glycine--tRNA ligase 1 n=1 Tax=Citrus sinensis TaxID=2711 RepID=A0ACB8IKP1_CITSI|nr:glycine--tRNA ligase 1 [Citrus sinensis]